MAKPSPFKESGNIINLIGIIVGVFFVLIVPKAYATLVGVSVIFVCAALIIWHLPWVENYSGRRVLLLVLLGVACVGFGYASWPVEQPPPSTQTATQTPAQAPAQAPAQTPTATLTTTTQTQTPELHGLLIPANERNPANWCESPTGAPSDLLNVRLGLLGLITPKPHMSVSIGGQEILAIARATGGIKISARVVDVSGKVVAQISDNELYVNPSNRFKMSRPDWHSLIIFDEYDREKRPVLNVYFANRTFVRVYGRFFAATGPPLILEENFSQIGGNIMQGRQVRCFAVNVSGRQGIDMGGAEFVIE